MKHVFLQFLMTYGRYEYYYLLQEESLLRVAKIEIAWK